MIRSINKYEKNLVLEALASLTEAEKQTLYNHIKTLKSLEAEAEAEAEASKVFEVLEAEAIAEAKAEVFKKALAEAEAKAIYNIFMSEVKEAEANFLNIAEAEAEALAFNIEVNNNTNYYYTSAEAIAQYIYEVKILEAEALSNKHFLEAEEEASILSKAIAEAEALELINFIHEKRLAFITEVKAEASAKAFIYVYNNISVLAEAEIKEASAKAKAEALEVLEVLTSEAKAEAKALILTSEAFNNIEPYNKAILSNYINFNSLEVKTKTYNKFNHEYINNIISLNIMLFDNTYFIILANNKVLDKLEALVTYKNISYKDKAILKAIKKASNKEAKASAKLEAEANFINDILLASIDFNFNNRYFIKTLEAEAKALAEAEAEVKAYLEALAKDNYFKFLRLKDLIFITEAEAEAYITEAIALTNQYKVNTSINDYLKAKEVFKNKKASNKVNTKYGLITKTSNRFKEVRSYKEVLEAKKNKAKAIAKTKPLYKYEAIAEAKAEAEAKAIALASLIALNYNISKDTKYKICCKALDIQRLNFKIGLEHYNLKIKEALEFTKAIDLI